MVCFGAMRQYLPASAEGNRGVLEVPTDASVGDVVDALGAHPKSPLPTMYNITFWTLTPEGMLVAQ